MIHQWYDVSLSETVFQFEEHPSLEVRVSDYHLMTLGTEESVERFLKFILDATLQKLTERKRLEPCTSPTTENTNGGYVATDVTSIVKELCTDYFGK